MPIHHQAEFFLKKQQQHGGNPGSHMDSSVIRYLTGYNERTHALRQNLLLFIDQSVNQFMIARRAKETGKEENQKITYRETVLFLQFVLEICESGKRTFLDCLMIDKMLRCNRWVSAKTGRNYICSYVCLAVLTVPGMASIPHCLNSNQYNPLKKFWMKRSTNN